MCIYTHTHAYTHIYIGFWTSLRRGLYGPYEVQDQVQSPAPGSGQYLVPTQARKTTVFWVA